jgi:hypothetical protein
MCHGSWEELRGGDLLGCWALFLFQCALVFSVPLEFARPYHEERSMGMYGYLLMGEQLLPAPARVQIIIC